MTIEQPNRNTENPLVGLAQKLDDLQGVENNGRGVSCVRAIVAYLRRGDKESAKTVFLTEADKIRNYPSIEQIIKDELFGDSIE